MLLLENGSIRKAMPEMFCFHTNVKNVAWCVFIWYIFLATRNSWKASKSDKIVVRVHATTAFDLPACFTKLLFFGLG